MTYSEVIINRGPEDFSSAETEKSTKAMSNFLSERSRRYPNNNNNSNSRYDFDLGVDEEDNPSRMKDWLSDVNAVATVNKVTVEDSLSEELMKLSCTDRQDIEEEVHGVARNTEETPEFLEWCLYEFDKELMTVKTSKQRRRKLQHQTDDEDVLRNVIRTSPDSVEETAGEESTTSTMETDTPMPLPTTVLEDDCHVTRDKSKRSCYVNDPEVRIRFLRAERYDSKNAVTRFVNFLEFARELFGDFVADRPMRISDFCTREEKRALANVSFQLLPFRDRSGRRVFVSVGSCGYDIPPRLRCKVLWYMYWIASEDVESQRKGMVIVGWPSENMLDPAHKILSDDDTKSGESDGGGSTESDRSRLWDGTLRPNISVVEGVYQVKTLDGMPMRIAAVHMCFQDRPIYRILNSLFYFAMNSYLKARYKVHVGEPLEIRYELQGFGIPVDLLPLTHTLTVKRQNHLQWIAFRKRIEQHHTKNKNDEGFTKSKKKPSEPLPIDPNDLVECPRSYDVIIGKAKYTNNPGNVFYRSLIEATLDEHISLSKRDKVELTWRIVREIEERNGRFLELNKALKVWVHIKDRTVMRQKVAQSYKEYKRNHPIRSKRNSEKENITSSKPSVKRQKIIVPTIVEKNCFSGCLRGCDDLDEILIPDSIFTSL